MGPGKLFYFCCVYFRNLRFNRVFSLTWPASMQMYWNKRKRLHKKRVQLPQDWFGTPTWPPFYCFGTPIWPPWRHVKTLYSFADIEPAGPHSYSFRFWVLNQYFSSGPKSYTWAFRNNPPPLPPLPGSGLNTACFFFLKEETFLPIVFDRPGPSCSKAD